MNSIIKNNKCIYRDLNLGPRKYEAAVETTRPCFLLLSDMPLVFRFTYTLFFLKTLLWFYCRSKHLPS